MINKDTIEMAFRHNPNKVYYVIQNPKLDSSSGKLVGLTLKTVEYRIKDWDKKEVRFEKLSLLKDKRFPEIIIFDKRYPDAENEVYAERVSKAKVKDEMYDSYAIFTEPKMANYHKLVRLHRMSEEMVAIYNALKEKKEKSTEKDYEPEFLAGDKNSSKKNKKSVTMTEIKGFFDEIQNTNYFVELELLQAENPDLAVK